MREILFKAKRVDNGEWAEGYLVKTKWYINEKEMYVILPIDVCFYPHCEISEWIEVDEKTICQYTGLTDKNGQKIWENDLIECKSNKKTYIDSHFLSQIVWDDDSTGFSFRDSQNGFSFMESIAEGGIYDCEVIGNIFDDPELIGGAENE